MPFTNLKTTLSFIATLIVFLGFAGMISSKESAVPIAQTGFGQVISDSGATQQPKKKFAVVIGVVYDNYELGNIAFADRDAASVYSLLTTKLGFPRENVRLLQNSQANRQGIIGALDWLSHNPDIDADSDVVFFYSGHGLRSAPDAGLNIPGVANSYALVPFDFMSYDYKKGQGLLWDNELADYLKDIHAGRMWIHIDSCSSGGFNKPGITGPNRIVTMSSRADELSSEIPEAQRGVMVQYMIENGMAKGLSVEESFAAAAPLAAQYYGQNPQIADEYAGNMDLGFSPQVTN